MEEQMPLYTALKNEADKNNIRMHMPGHKGKALGALGGADLFQIDFTELAATGNLYEGIEPISNAEALMAAAAGAKECYYLAGGSTQGVMTALAATCLPGSKIIVDRGSHRSVWSAMAHLDLRPVYVQPERLAPWDIAAPIQAQQIDDALTANPDAEAVILTSPTYYGVIADIASIAAVTDRFGVPLITDEAHGAHLPFLTGGGCAVSQGASLSAVSAHKTLPALTPGAFLFSAGRYDPRDIRRKAAMFGTSSPSYAVMASMDAARAYMLGQGGERYRQAAQAVGQVRKMINADGRFRALADADGLAIDPTRLTICTETGGLSGYRAYEILESEFGIVCEMADRKNIVMIVTCADSPADMDRVCRALLGICGECVSPGLSGPPLPGRYPTTIQRCTPRQAAYAPRKYVRLGDAAGMTAGEHLAPYPPGIPVVAAGEMLSAEHLEYLRALGVDMQKEIAVLADNPSDNRTI